MPEDYSQYYNIILYRLGTIIQYTLFRQCQVQQTNVLPCVYTLFRQCQVQQTNALPCVYTLFRQCQVEQTNVLSCVYTLFRLCQVQQTNVLHGIVLYTFQTVPSVAD